MAFSTLMMLVKYAGDSGVSLPEIMFWRQAIPIPLVFGWLAVTGGLHRLRTRRAPIHARRAAIGMTNMVFTFGAAILLPLPVSTTLGFTSPLFAVLASGLLLREPVGPWRWTAVALGFAGVIAIAQPGGEPVPALGAICGLVAACLIVAVNFQIRDLGRTEDAMATSFYFAAFGAPLAALALPFFHSPHTAHQWLVLIGMGLCGAIGQFLLAASLRHGSVASIMVMDYSALIWATLYGWLIWDHLPSAATWIGAPLIVAAGTTIAWREHRLSRPPRPVSTIELD